MCNERPDWYPAFLSNGDYFGPCRRCFDMNETRTAARDKQINFFMASEQSFHTACAHCRPRLERLGYQTLQVRRSSHQNVVKVEELQGLYPDAVKGVQEYTINNLKVAFLRTRPVPRESKSGACCLNCSRGIQEKNCFCSLECKLVHVGDADNTRTSSAAPQSPSSSNEAVNITFSPFFNFSQSFQGPPAENYSGDIVHSPQEYRPQIAWETRKRRKRSNPTRSPS